MPKSIKQSVLNTTVKKDKNHQIKQLLLKLAKNIKNKKAEIEPNQQPDPKTKFKPQSESNIEIRNNSETNLEQQFSDGLKENFLKMFEESNQGYHPQIKFKLNDNPTESLKRFSTLLSGAVKDADNTKVHVPIIGLHQYLTIKTTQETNQNTTKLHTILNKLKPFIDTLKENFINFDFDPFEISNSNVLDAMTNQEYFPMPLATKGHAMSCSLNFQNKQYVDFNIFNTEGYGLNNEHEHIQLGNKKKYATKLTFRLNKDDKLNENIKKITDTINSTFQKRETEDGLFKKPFKQNRIYEEIKKSMKEMGIQEPIKEHIFQTKQKDGAGNCTLESIMAMLNDFLNLDEYLLFRETLANDMLTMIKDEDVNEVISEALLKQKENRKTKREELYGIYEKINNPKVPASTIQADTPEKFVRTLQQMYRINEENKSNGETEKTQQCDQTLQKMAKDHITEHPEHANILEFMTV